MSELYSSNRQLYSSTYAIYGSDVNDTTTFRYFSGTDDTCYIKIQKNRYSDSKVPVPYRVIVNFSHVEDDRFEENDTKFTAHRIEPGIYDSLVSIMSNSDFFKLVFDSAVRIQVGVRSPLQFSNDKNLRVSLQSRNSSISNSRTSGDSVLLSYVITPGDTLFLSVSNSIYRTLSAKEAFIPYTLEIQATSLIMQDDTLEENDSLLSATVIEQGLYLLQCYDDDWFSVTLRPGQLLQLNAELMNQVPGEFSLTLYKSFDDFNKGIVLGSCPVLFQQTSGFTYTAESDNTFYFLFKSLKNYQTINTCMYALRVIRTNQ